MHEKVVGGNQPAIADAPAQNLGDPFFREGSWKLVPRDRRVIGMIDQHHGQLALHCAVWDEVFLPELGQRLLDHRQIVVRIEVTLSQAWKVLAAADDACGFEAAEKSARVADHVFGISREGPRAHHRA